MEALEAAAASLQPGTKLPGFVSAGVVQADKGQGQQTEPAQGVGQVPQPEGSHEMAINTPWSLQMYLHEAALCDAVKAS